EAIEYFRKAKKAGAPTAQAELARLSAQCLLPATPITGADYNEYYANVMESLQKMYSRRLEHAPRLKGKLKLRVENDGNGRITGLDVTENTLNDPWLEAHLFYAVLDSKFPKYDNKKFGMPFVLDPATRPV